MLNGRASQLKGLWILSSFKSLTHGRRKHLNVLPKVTAEERDFCPQLQSIPNVLLYQAGSASAISGTANMGENSFSSAELDF